eukprot:Skav206077  [mRNA]  locus=scaffold1771:223605:249915:+ [translate_table: standard]
MKLVAWFAVIPCVTAVVVQSLTDETKVLLDVRAVEAQSDRFYAEISSAQDVELRRVQELKPNSELLPALAMLRSVYADGKERIAKLNKQEEDSKKDFQAKEHAHGQKLSDIRKKLDGKKISEQFYQTEVKDENRIWSYWTKVRAHQHRQFLAALRVQHGTMKKVSHMIDLYEKTLAAKGKSA